MGRLLYHLVRGLISLVQTLPVRWVARIGRGCGLLVYGLDRRHRRVALRNLTNCFGRERSPQEIRALARENFKRIGEGVGCAIRTAAMSADEVRQHVEFEGADHFRPRPENPRPLRCVVAVGHFGNFELYARLGQFMPEFQGATTYRGLRQPWLNEIIQSMRERSGCRYFERRTDAAALKAAMGEPNIMLGLLADQHGGDRGIILPFLGQPCSTGTAPALFALRYQCPLFTGFCFRTGLGRWRLEPGAEIPTVVNGEPRSVEAICLDINRAFETAVRRDPANWFWVHNRWKPGKGRPVRRHTENTAPATAASEMQGGPEGAS